jgi:hypothetical protein
MSGIDPDVQAAFSGTPAAPTQQPALDPDIQAAFQEDAKGASTVPPMDARKDPNLPWNAVKALAGGVAHGVGTLVDVATGTSPGPGSHAEAFAKPFATPPYAQDIAEQDVPQGISKAYDRIAGTGPLATTLKERVPQAAEAIGTVTGAGSFVKGVIAKAPMEVAAEPHPLQGVADLEAQKLTQVDQRLAQQGFALPSDRQISPIVRQSNNVVAKDLNLPKDAPLTEGMIESGIKANALPAYAEVRKIAPWEASPAYETDAKGINLDLIDKDIRPPAAGNLDGPETVRLSQSLRNASRDYWKSYASNPDPATKKIAMAHDAAAEAVENEFERHVADVPGLSDSWDAARTYVAKAKNVEAALDGAGNVRPTMLKSQMLKGKPLSGGVQDLAVAAAKYPDYFKTTPMMPPQVGLTRRIAAKFATPAATAIGGTIGGTAGFPTTGAVLGNEAGAKLSSILNPGQR